MSPSFRPILALLALLALSGCAQPCRTGFDVGSSGIRVGSSCRPETARVSIDYLADVWADGMLDATIEPTVEAFRALPGKAGLPAPNPMAPNAVAPNAVAGGYSAWRLALERGGAERVAAILADIEARSGVRLLVIPQEVEGDYGYHAARRALGERLTTDSVLDIGGGSLQVARPGGGWGAALGQKAWRRRFCVEIRNDADGECEPNPVGPDAIARTEAVLAPLLAEARSTLGQGFTVTGVSSPLVRGLYPTLRHLATGPGRIAGRVDQRGFDRAALASAITLLAGRDDAAILALLDNCRENGAAPPCRAGHLGNLVTDMLLVHGLMAGLGLERIEVAAADITNVPGLLADPRAAAWAANYPCYLDRLVRQGVAAFHGDPATCPR